MSRRQYDYALIRRCLLAGMPVPEIAEIAGCSVPTVIRARDEAGLTPPAIRRSRRFDADHIRQRLLDGDIAEEIAGEIGCSAAWVHRVRLKMSEEDKALCLNRRRERLAEQTRIRQEAERARAHALDAERRRREAVVERLRAQRRRAERLERALEGLRRASSADSPAIA